MGLAAMSNYSINQKAAIGSAGDAPFQSTTVQVPATKPKQQPWKASWPPQAETTAGQGHGARDGVVYEADGFARESAHYPRC